MKNRKKINLENLEIANQLISTFVNADATIETTIVSNVEFEQVVIEISEKDYFSIIEITEDNINALSYNIAKRKPKLVSTYVRDYTTSPIEYLTQIIHNITKTGLVNDIV